MVVNLNDELPEKLLQILKEVHRGVYDLQDVKDLASEITFYLAERGYDLYFEANGSFTAVKTEYL